jgi:hypothetical protein
MCFTLFLSTDKPVPEQMKENSSGGVFLSELTGQEKSAGEVFSYSHTYYVHSSDGCGCGFLKDGLTSEEIWVTLFDYYILVEIIKQLFMLKQDVELYACWYAEQSAHPLQSINISLDDLLENSFQFQEKVLYKLK